MVRPLKKERPSDTAAKDHQRFRMTIAYDGTAYQGWQVQKIGTGVQEKVEEALAKLFAAKPRLSSSSRTDTGVHASAMEVHFDVPLAQVRMTPDKLLMAVNAHLPEDIRVMQARKAHRRFHARFHSSGKEYRYQVWNHPALHPLHRKTAWHVKRALDLKAMQRAAKHFVGERDFRSFRANPDYDTTSTVRTLSQVSVRRTGPLLTFVIRGNGFLYKMCRGIVGTLVQVGEGKIAPDEIAAILAGKDRRLAGMTAPALGLELRKVFYGKRTERDEGGDEE